MPRTVNVEAHRLRKDAFLDVAQRLIQSKGYETMSIQDVLAELETSRGALYHYFDSKEALLDGVVERFADAALREVDPILADSSLPALTKLERIFRSVARFKAEQKELVLAIIHAWTSDANALVREKVRRLTARWLGPILTSVIEQGIGEGVIACSSPQKSARVLLHLIQGYQEVAGEQFLARQAGRITYAEVLETHAAFMEAFERILGLAPGSVTLTDEATLKFWFG
jgi:AcrR family transcriptional regulator